MAMSRVLRIPLKRAMPVLDRLIVEKYWNDIHRLIDDLSPLRDACEAFLEHLESVLEIVKSNLGCNEIKTTLDNAREKLGGQQSMQLWGNWCAQLPECSPPSEVLEIAALTPYLKRAKLSLQEILLRFDCLICPDHDLLGDLSADLCQLIPLWELCIHPVSHHKLGNNGVFPSLLQSLNNVRTKLFDWKAATKVHVPLLLQLSRLRRPLANMLEKLNRTYQQLEEQSNCIGLKLQEVSNLEKLREEYEHWCSDPTVQSWCEKKRLANELESSIRKQLKRLKKITNSKRKLIDETDVSYDELVRAIQSGLKAECSRNLVCEISSVLSKLESKTFPDEVLDPILTLPADIDELQSYHTEIDFIESTSGLKERCSVFQDVEAEYSMLKLKAETAAAYYRDAVDKLETFHNDFELASRLYEAIGMAEFHVRLEIVANQA